MYFDFSKRTLLPLALICAALCAAVAASFALFIRTSPLQERTGDAAKRYAVGALYWLRFDALPFGLAAAGAQRAPAAASAVAATTSAASIPVLLYHGEGPEPSATMPLSTFVAQMRALQDAGWRTVTLEEFTAFLRGDAALPDKSFLLTFDDGRRDTFYAVDPALYDLHDTAVMFVITGFSLPDNGPAPINGFYLSKAELAAMAASGRWELESHGDEDHRLYPVPLSATSTAPLSPDGHFLSDKFWDASTSALESDEAFAARVTADLARAKQLLEADFGAPVTAFAYPLNDFGEDSVNFPESQTTLDSIVPSLYDYAFYQTWPGNGDSFNYPLAGNGPGAQPYMVKRIEPKNSWTGADLLAMLDGGRAKALPYSAETFGSDWGTNWGAVSGGQALALTAASSTTGAAAFLDGTAGWENYLVRAAASVENGTLSLIARHTEDDVPYPVCAFSNDRIYLESHTARGQALVASKPYAPPALPAALSVAMRVDGTSVSCEAYGVAVSASIAGIPRAGGIGASVWDPTPGAAQAAIESLSVAPI